MVLQTGSKFFEVRSVLSKITARRDTSQQGGPPGRSGGRSEPPYQDGRAGRLPRLEPKRYLPEALEKETTKACLLHGSSDVSQGSLREKLL